MGVIGVGGVSGGDGVSCESLLTSSNKNLDSILNNLLVCVSGFHMLYCLPKHDH